MNKKQAKSFLKGLGIKPELIEKLVKHIPEDAEASTIEDIDAAYDSIRDHQIELFQSGDTYKAALKTAADRKLAEAMSTAEKKVKKIAGLTEDETKDKKFDEIVDLAIKATKTLGLDIAGVDIIFDRKKEKYIVLEVNGVILIQHF